MFRSEEQANFSALMSRHMDRQDGPLLMEGATGLGKTRAYLAAVMEFAKNGKRIAIALPSHQLIDQLLLSSDLTAVQSDRIAVAAFRPRRWFEHPDEYRAQRIAAMNAAVMLCTSAAVIIDQRLSGAYNGVTTRDYLVFDEADQLPDAAALQSDFEITRHQLSELGISATSVQQAATAVIAHKAVEPEVRAAARMILEAVEEPAWFHRAGITDDGGVMLFHKMPGRLLKKVANRRDVAFVSATLTVGGKFDSFKRALGIQQHSELSSIIEPESHGRLTFNVADAEVDSPLWFELIENSISQSVKSGPVLVATTSFALATVLAEKVPGATLRGSDETSSQAAARMGPGQVLIAAGAWAGLDTPVRWKTIIVPRIPFERPVILDGEVESSYVDTRNTAVRRMRQVIGRGLRSPDAECTVHILDRRYRQVESFVPKRFRQCWAERVFQEGQRTEFTLSKLERDASVRKAALAHFGQRCMSCGFLPRVLSQLDVHHLHPLADGGERLTALSDVAVLCCNCHRLAHSSAPPMTIAALQALVLPD